MTIRLKAIWLTAVLSAICGLAPAAETEFKVDKDMLGRLEFQSPADIGQKKYLGLGDNKTFRLSDVKARILVIEIFSMYCPVCQAEAPSVNQIYKIIANDRKLKGKVKIIGIGIGNTPFEVNVFREKFNTLFPLVPDENHLIQKALSGQIRTPTFIVAKMEPKKKVQLLNVHIGRTERPDTILKGLR